jgi:hypothetical protein
MHRITTLAASHFAAPGAPDGTPSCLGRVTRRYSGVNTTDLATQTEGPGDYNHAHQNGVRRAAARCIVAARTGGVRQGYTISFGRRRHRRNTARQGQL